MSTRILLVEDTPELRRLFARLLTHRGLEVCEAADGQEALDRLSTFAPDVVLTDLMMPVVDGFELIRRIRAMAVLDGVPVVAMTAATSAEAVREALAAGAAEVLAKPLDGWTLFDRIRNVHQSDRFRPTPPAAAPASGARWGAQAGRRPAPPTWAGMTPETRQLIAKVETILTESQQVRLATIAARGRSAELVAEVSQSRIELRLHRCQLAETVRRAQKSQNRYSPRWPLA
jgi:CheY-like chemotaxis protein